jgi:hypothetical protein
VVQHDFAQLKEWADLLIPMLHAPDVYMIDVDEVHNRVYVGVRDEAAIQTVAMRASELGLPVSALTVEVIGRPRPRNLQGYTATLMGGYQIGVITPWSVPAPCTLGFNATFGGQEVFVTNSHCTAKWWEPDGGAIYQPVWGQFAPVGHEVADVSPRFCGPFINPWCRDSDAAYVLHSQTRVIAQGRIARSVRRSFLGRSWPGDPAVVYEPAHRITHLYTHPVVVGTVLDKTGRTSGQTFGRVTQTCVSLDSGEGFWFRCQDVSSMYSTGGDSGSPVYQVLGGGFHDVALQGILWGGPEGDPWVTYSSRLSGIQADLGTLNSICAPGYGC